MPSGLQLATWVVVNEVLRVNPGSVNNPTPVNPPTFFATNPTGQSIGIVQSFSRIHLHTKPPNAVNEVDLLVFRGSDFSPLAGVAMDIGQGDPIVAAERDFNWMQSGGYFRLGPGESAITQLWAFSSGSESLQVGIFAALFYFVIPPRRVVQVEVVDPGKADHARVMQLYDDGTTDIVTV